MARVRSLGKGMQSVKAHPSEVDCYWQIIRSADGGRLLHLTTFGSDKRASVPKSSQSLQIDANIAQEIIQVLRSTFPGID